MSNSNRIKNLQLCNESTKLLESAIDSYCNCINCVYLLDIQNSSSKSRNKRRINDSMSILLTSYTPVKQELRVLENIADMKLCTICHSK